MSELVDKLARQSMSASDLEFHKLADDEDLGKADYDEFLFSEAVEVLKREGVEDPEGHLFLWLEQGYLYGGKAISKAKGAPFASTPRGVYQFRITEAGHEIARLGRNG